jgi:hypothetical protein
VSIYAATVECLGKGLMAASKRKRERRSVAFGWSEAAGALERSDLDAKLAVSTGSVHGKDGRPNVIVLGTRLDATLRDCLAVD